MRDVRSNCTDLWHGWVGARAVGRLPSVDASTITLRIHVLVSGDLDHADDIALETCITRSLAGRRVALVAADEPKKPPASRPARPVARRRKWPQALQEAWPDHPEWVDMLTAILQDEPMSADLRLVPHGRGADAASTGSRPASASIATATARSRGPSSPAATPISRGSTATATRHSPRPISTSRAAALAPLARRDRVFAARSRRQRQGHARGARRVLPGHRQRRPGLPVALRPARGVHAAARARPIAAGSGRPSKATWSAASSARRSARFSPGPSSTNPRPTSP